MKKSKLVLASTLLVTSISVGVITISQNIFDKGLNLTTANDSIAGSILFSRSISSFQDLGNNVASISGITERRSTYYAISHNSSNISETNYVASLSAVENYVSFSSSSIDGDFAFQALTGVRIVSTSSESQNVKVYFSNDGVNFNNYEMAQASTSGTKLSFASSHKYLRLGGVSESVDITAIELFFSCSPSGSEEEETTMFDEINSKIDFATKSFGNFLGDSQQQNRASSKKIVSRSADYINYDITIGDDGYVYYGGYNTHVPDPGTGIFSMWVKYDTMTWSINGNDTGVKALQVPNIGRYFEQPGKQYQLCTIEDLFNHEQQLKYILTIYNYIHENLTNGSYGPTLEYGKIYEGEGFMETIYSLNTAIRAYGWQKPKLKIMVEKEDNVLTFYSSWDYRSPQMAAYVPYWNTRILSTAKFFFNESGELIKAASNYNFDGDYTYNTATALFDFEHEMYYALYSGNSAGDQTSFPDYKTTNATKHNILNKFNSGEATSEFKYACSSKHAQKAKMSLDSNANDIVARRAWFNRLDILDIDDYNDWSNPDECTEDQFYELWDEIYPVVSEIKFVTEFEDDNNVDVGNLFDQAAKYAFWKSVFVCDSATKITYIPYIEYEPLVKYLGQLAQVSSGDIKADLETMLSAVVSKENQYIGNNLEIEDVEYKISISSEDTSQYFFDNLLTYSCSNGFSYVISKNNVNFIRFRVVDGNAQLV